MTQLRRKTVSNRMVCACCRKFLYLYSNNEYANSPTIRYTTKLVMSIPERANQYENLYAPIYIDCYTYTYTGHTDNVKYRREARKFKRARVSCALFIHNIFYVCLFSTISMHTPAIAFWLLVYILL